LVANANRGLIAFRSGDSKRGVELYRKAITGFRSKNNIHLARLAQAYFAREAVRAVLPEANKLFREAKDGLSPSTNPAAAKVIKSTEMMLTTASQK